MAGCIRWTLRWCSSQNSLPASDPSQSLGESDGASEETSAESGGTSTGTPTVYMTTDISAEGLMAIYEALGASPSGNIAVKLSTGEPGSNYLRTDLIGDLVQSFDSPTIVECNTAYGGQRANTAMHYQVAEDHGYTAIADVDIMDENGSMTLPVTGGSNLTEKLCRRQFCQLRLLCCEYLKTGDVIGKCMSFGKRKEGLEMADSMGCTQSGERSESCFFRAAE